MSKALEAANEELKSTNIALEKAVERANQMALEAAAASTARSRFFANVSHEIRTPLNGIIGMIALTMETALTAEQQNYLKMAKDSADNLLEIINDILDFSKMDADKLEIEEIEFNLWELIGKTTKSLAIKAYEKSLQFIVQMKSDVPAYAYGDPTRIRQVLTNLINNAIKFTSKGTIKIKIASHSLNQKHTINGLEKKIMLECTVMDTGIGISKKNLAVIFNPFSQVDSSVSRKFGGTGLGLNISKHLARLMGGNIEVESKEGYGSSFKASFTLKTSEDTMVIKTLAERISKKELVLIVNDDSTRETLQESLASLAFQVFSFKSINEFYGTEYYTLLRKTEKARGVGAILIDDDALFYSEEELIKKIFEQLKKPVVFAEFPSALTVDKAVMGKAFSAMMLKPIIEYELLEILLQLERGREMSAIHKLASHYVMTDTSPKLKILVAEDNLINLKLMEQLLINQGHKVISTISGRKTIELLEQQKFDALFLDIQMPDMDGFSVAKRIRRWSYPDSSVPSYVADNIKYASTMPIVAITANVLPQDKNKCKAAGMNLFLGKPLVKEELLKVLAYIAKQKISLPADLLLQETNVVSATDPLNVDAPPILDVESTIGRTGESPDFIKELIKIFLTITPKTIENLNAALSSENQDKAEEIAHTLKGSAAALGAERMRIIASHLEELAKSGEWYRALEELKKAEPCFEETFAELEKVLNKK
jgi:signal transduction histidine kinase/CheY-like chemotaxis protein/HPt (histidine-containing phosphotransfer) domain-containing protein